MEIRAWYGPWREVDRKRAGKLIKHLLAGMTNIRAEQKAAYVEARHLRGATVAEVLGGKGGEY